MSNVRDLEVVQAKGYTFISAGAAYNLTMDFYPDFVEVFNYTQAGTTAKITASRWFKGFPAGDCISIQTVIDSASTGNTTGVLETTNGFTWAGVAAGFTTEQKTISGATAATPGVITTSAVHGLTDGDRVIIQDVVGMVELNSNTYQVDVLTTTTFALQDFKGNSIDTSGFTAYSSGGEITRIRDSGDIENAEETYILTLGTGVVGANSDVLYVHALKYAGGITDLGDIA